MTESYILDTCVFNRLADGEIKLSDISAGGLLFATQLQRDELLATSLESRREELVAAFHAVNPRILATETFCCDVSHFDIDKWGNGELFDKLKACLDAKQKKPNNTQDALIAEVAIVQNLTLVTADRNLAETARRHGAKVLCIG